MNLANTDSPADLPGAAGPLLLVEDDPTVVRAVLLALSIGGVGPVETASTGPEAEERLQPGHGYRMVLMDRMIAGTDGLDVLARLRSRGDRTPVVMVSADATESARRQADALGADGYLVKPFDLDVLFETVGRLAG